jgi:hypothetical protein
VNSRSSSDTSIYACASLAALVVILLRVSVLALAATGSEPPNRGQSFNHLSKEPESEHDKTLPSLPGFTI